MLGNSISNRLKKPLLEIANVLAPYTKRAYAVGGSVRDMILGLKVKDLDIEVYDLSQDRFDTIMRDIGAKGVGKSFFVYKYKDIIDIALPRIEKKISFGHRGFSVQRSNDIKEATKRRDFTMNSLLSNIFTNEIVDLYGGKADITNRHIKIINEHSFKEDSLRVLRAMRFSSELGFRIDKASLSIMREMNLEDLSRDRIFWEFDKMFKSYFLHYGLFYLFKLNIAKKIFDLDISYSSFIKSALEIQRGSKNFVDSVREFYFLYILAKNINLQPNFFLKKMSSPNIYRRAFINQKIFDKHETITDEDILSISISYPIKKWLGNYKDGIKKRALKLGVFYNCFDGGVLAKDIIRDGYRGKDISIELHRRKMQKIASLTNSMPK